MRIIFKFTAICFMLLFIYFIYYRFIYNFYYTDGEKDGNEIISPDGKYSAQVDYQNYGGAAGGVNSIVNVIFHSNDNLEQTIYFSNAKGIVQLDWLDDDIISIKNYDEYEDRSIELVVGKEIYDERGKACKSKKINKRYVCYSESSDKNISEM